MRTDDDILTFNEFIDESTNFWNDYLKSIYGLINLNILSFENGKILFPNIALFTETDSHFILELFGADRDFKELVVKKNKQSSTIAYLYQFKSEQEGLTIHLNGRDSGMKWLSLTRDIDNKILKERFGFIDRWKSVLHFQNGKGALLSFGTEFKSHYISDCLIVNQYNEIYRVKHISYMAIISKNFSKKMYLDDLNNSIIRPPKSSGDLLATIFCTDDKDESYVVSGQFSNLFLTSGIHETTIGEFINKNPIFIQKAFSTSKFIYEPLLNWEEGNDKSEELYINPDMLIKRPDGFYDICDLKTCKLDRMRITKGEHKRRRFIDYVEEGIAQLANYEEYFMYQKNREFAFKKYGIEINNPNLYLIVGSYENAKKDEIIEASRKLKANYRIIDYDTLNAMFLSFI